MACHPETPFALRWHEHAHRVAHGSLVSHLRIDSGGCAIRLDLVGGFVDATALTIIPELRVHEGFACQLLAVQRLHRLLAERPLQPAEDKRLVGLVLALRALDARGEGHGLREIAIHLLGLDEWPGKGDWAKSRARRLVNLAARLKRAGPRGVLRWAI
jgi:hypothetical protein